MLEKFGIRNSYELAYQAELGSRSEMIYKLAYQAELGNWRLLWGRKIVSILILIVILNRLRFDMHEIGKHIY